MLRNAMNSKGFSTIQNLVLDGARFFPVGGESERRGEVETPRPPFPRLSPVAQPRVRTGFPDLVLEGGDGWDVGKFEKARETRKT